MSFERDRARVVDLSRPGGELAVELDLAEAAELLLSVGVLMGDNEPDSFALGAERIADLREAMPPDLLAAAEDRQGCSASQLLGLVYTTPKPRTAAALLERLRDIDPVELQLHRLGYYARGHHIAEPATISRAAEGDTEAQRELLEAAREWESKHFVLDRLFDRGPEHAKDDLVDLLSRWHQEVFPAIAAEAAPLAERDLEAKRSLVETLPPERVVERFVPGMEYTPTPDVHRIVLFPAYSSRPWVYMHEHKNVKIFCYPITVDREQVAADDPAELVRVYKALADEGRLKLLKRLRSGPITLAEAAEEIGLAKSTAHHHLAILRQAGFVVIREDDDLYSLRPDLPAGQLDRYLRV